MFFLSADAAITPARLAQLAPHCDAATIAPTLEESANSHDITTPKRVRHFLAQLSWESGGFARLSENLDYTDPAELVRLWPAHMPAVSIAEAYVRQPQKLANLVYGGRFGNAGPDDGWTYRGRGWIQVTFKSNYHAMTPYAGRDLVADPDALATPWIASTVSAAWWAARGLNALADADDVEGITRIVNGGLNGLAGRQAALARAQQIWPG